MVPREMNVVEIAAPGGPEQLKIAIRPVPQPGEGEVLMRVAAAGVNRPDVMQRQGRYPPPPGASDLPGWRSRARSRRIGRRGVGLGIVGEKCTALLPGGGYAAYAVAAAPLCLPVPEGLSMIEAAAVPETFFTVWTNLFDRGGCQPGETVLIHGGTSGIGTTAIQLAAAWGARVFATAGSADKARACERLRRRPRHRLPHRGFRRGDPPGNRRHAERTSFWTWWARSYLARNLEAAAVEGRLVVDLPLGGARAEINLGTIMAKRLTLTGSRLRSRTVAQKAVVADAVRRNVWPLLAAGRVRPIIYATFPLAEASEAHRLMESSQHIGKIVLTV